MLTIFVAIAIIAATTTCDVGFPDTINAIRIEGGELLIFDQKSH